MSKIDKELWGVDVDRAYKEYKKRIKGRIKYVEDTLGGYMYDGNAAYDKETFRAVLFNRMADIPELDPSAAAKIVLNYQAYGDFTTNQAEALRRHMETKGEHLTTEQARAKSKEISEYYEDLKKKGYTVEEAKKEISWVFFGSK
jgi:hypothetical protein